MSQERLGKSVDGRISQVTFSWHPCGRWFFTSLLHQSVPKLIMFLQILQQTDLMLSTIETGWRHCRADAASAVLARGRRRLIIGDYITENLLSGEPFSLSVLRALFNFQNMYVVCWYTRRSTISSYCNIAADKCTETTFI